MTNTMDDIEQAKAILVIGSNTTEAHPIIGLRIKKAVMQNDCKLIVAEPMHIRLCYYADKWLRHMPGTDVALLNGMMNVIISEGLYDETFVHERCDGFDELVELVKEYTPERAAEITGVAAEDIREAARTFANAATGWLVEAMGWHGFFLLCAVLAIPGMLLLLKVAPWNEVPADSVGQQEPA